MTVPARTGPLVGLRVLDLSRLYPGAFCTSMLADLGADVVKVEAPKGGDGLRTMTPDPFQAGHVSLNRGKRSLALDLKAPGALDVLRRLILGSDVVVESHRPGALDALGVGYDACTAEHPGLIWCSLTGFGVDGPDAHAPGHDLTYVGRSGVLGLLVEPGATPPVPQMTVALPAGAMVAVIGIVSAVAQRARTGHGARVDTSLVEAASWMISEDIARAASAPAPGWPPFASRAVYRCADGRHVTVAAAEPRTWATLCAALDVPDLADHRLGVDEAAATSRLAAVFATRPAAHWCTAPGLAGGVGPVHAPLDVLTDAQFQARGAISMIDGTSTRVLAGPVRLRGADGATTPATAPPPAIGEHTDEVLTTAGFTTDEVAALRSAGVV